MHLTYSKKTTLISFLKEHKTVKMNTGYTVQNNTKIAFRDGLPIGIGYLAISFAFGLMATAYDLTILEAVLISAFNLTSAGQLASLPIIAGGGTLIELALTELLINLRYSLMSISLSQRFDKKIKTCDRFYLSFALTDEIFAVAIGRQETLGKKYLLSLILFPYIGWTLGTLLGAVAGNVLPDILVTALGISMYAMFIAIIVPAVKKEKSVALCVLISITFSSLFEFMPLLNKVPDGFVIIISALIASIALALIAPIKDEEELDKPSETEKTGGCVNE